MKKFILKKLLSKNGYYDREIFCKAMDQGILKFFYFRAYRKFFKPRFPKIQFKKSIHAMERLASNLEPINLKSRLKYFIKKFI